MPGSKESARAEAIHVRLKENHPEWGFKGSEPYDKGAIIFDRRTGRPIRRFYKNFDAENWLKNPEGAACEQKGLTPLVDVPPEINLKSWAENKAIKALHTLRGHVEIVGLGQGEITVKIDEIGLPCELEYAGIKYTVNGRKGR